VTFPVAVEGETVAVRITGEPYATGFPFAFNVTEDVAAINPWMKIKPKAAAARCEGARRIELKCGDFRRRLRL